MSALLRGGKRPLREVVVGLPKVGLLLGASPVPAG